MDIEKQIEYWRKSAEHDLDTAESLFEAKKFDWTLFLGHLVLEKTLKAIYIKKKETFPPKTHNLLFLAKEAEIQFEDAVADFFEEVNTLQYINRVP